MSHINRVVTGARTANTTKFVVSDCQCYTHGEVVAAADLARAEWIVVAVADVEERPVVTVIMEHTEMLASNNVCFVAHGGKNHYRVHEWTRGGSRQVWIYA